MDMAMGMGNGSSMGGGGMQVSRMRWNACSLWKTCYPLLIFCPCIVYSMMTAQMDLYLADPCREVSSLNFYPIVKKIFLKTNTALPSSSSAKRIFSLGGQMTMQMSFYASAEATILFVGWHTTTWSEMLGSCIAVLVMSVIYEGLKTFRQFLKERSLVVNRSLLDSYRSTTPTEEFSVGEITPPWLSAQRLYWLHHVTQSVLHLLQCTLSYFLMLIAMTFNVWLFISIVIGSMLGYFICNLKRSLRADVVQDHCH